jgi:hypothetical protein
VGTDSDGDGVDRQCGDSLCDNANGVTDATKTASETVCDDGKDNDCDGSIDGADSDCCTCTPDQIFCNGNTVALCHADCRTSTPLENCDARDKWVCNGDVREYQDYSCGSGSCIYSTTSSEDCTAKSSVDSDGGATEFQTPGTVTDFTTCTPSQCNSDTFSDACSDTVLTEYSASGNAYTSILKECQEFEDHSCPGNRYYRNEWSCTGGRCLSLGTQTYEGLNPDGDSVDTQCGDSPPCDTVTGIWDENKETVETSCADGLDNDCDGQSDCADSDCQASLSGTVRNEKGQPISGATIRFSTMPAPLTTTTSNGEYTLNGVCGTFDVTVEHPVYISKSLPLSTIPLTSHVLSFEGANALEYNCESDCTSAGDNTIHKECRGRAGCTFHDSHAADICDGYRPGQLRAYSPTEYVRCSGGAPQVYTCSSGAIERSRATITVNRAPINLVLSSC